LNVIVFNPLRKAGEAMSILAENKDIDVVLMDI
jgi:hypothetical protein